MYRDLRLEISDGIARITLTRPERLNALGNSTGDELLAALRAAEAGAVADGSVRAVILTGEGRAFGAGYDLASLDPGAVPDLARVIEDHFNPLIRAMRASPLPIVAAVNGACAGGSVGLALACDLVIAGRSAYFLESFVGISLVPDLGNTLFMTGIAGRIRTAGAMYLCDRISAEEAERWGLVWRVVEDDRLLPEAEAVAARLATRPAKALAATKRLIGRAADSGLDAHLDHERDLQGEAGRSPELRTAIEAFFATRRA